MRRIFKSILTGVAGIVLLSSMGTAISSNNVHAEDYMRPAENRATYSRRVYVRKPIKVERMTGSVFATMHRMYWKHLHRNQRIGIAPFYHMGHDGYVIHIPGTRNIYYAPTNSHRWFGKKVRVHHHYHHHHHRYY